MCSKGKTKPHSGGTQFTSPDKTDPTWLGGSSWIWRRAEDIQGWCHQLQTSHLAAGFGQGVWENLSQDSAGAPEHEHLFHIHLLLKKKKNGPALWT